MADVDLLVRQEDAPAVLSALAGVGYYPAAAEVRPDAQSEFRYAALLQRAQGGPLLDVHWTLFHSQYYQHHLPMDWFWQDLRTVKVGPAEARVLRPAAQLLHLCGHVLLHHKEGDLAQMHDIAALVVHSGPALDWDEVLAGAELCALLLPLQRVLPRLAGQWRLPLPPHVLARVATRVASAGERQAFAALTARDRPVASRFLADLLGNPAWRGRLRFLGATLFPTPAYLRARYGARGGLWLPLYYPLHWLSSLRRQ
jgi:hypothetical protein